MMHLSSFFSLSLIFFVLEYGGPTAAAALAVSPVKRGRLIDPIECPYSLPNYIPPDFPQFPGLLEMCAARAGHPMNLECKCVGDLLFCGSDRRDDVKALIDYCFDHCNCGDEPHARKDEPTMPLNFPVPPIQFGTGEFPPLPHGVSPFEVLPFPGTGTTRPSTTRGHTCTNTCTSVNRGCAWESTGECKCYAPPVSLFFWFGGDCGRVHHRPADELKRRDLAQQRARFYLNASAQYARPPAHGYDNAPTPVPGPSPDRAAHVASGLLPSPCNGSYVSFACVDALDGIVHEPLHKWLGAVLPADAKFIPPVPERFLKIHGGKQPVFVDVD